METRTTIVLSKIETGLARLLDTRNLYVALHDVEHNWIRFAFAKQDGQQVHLGAPDCPEVWRDRPFGNGLTEFVIKNRSSLLIEDSFDEKAQALGVQSFKIGTKCWLGSPMIIGGQPHNGEIIGGQVLGVIAVQNFEREHVFDARSLNVLSAVASQAAIALHNAQLYDHITQELDIRIRQLDRKVNELAALTEMSRGAVSNLGVDQILDLVYEQAGKIMGLSNAQVQIAFYDEAKDEVSFPLAVEQDNGTIIDRVRWGEREDEYKRQGEDQAVPQFKPRTRKERFGLNEYIIHNRKPLLILEAFEGKAQELGVQVFPRFGRKNRPTESFMGVPMMISSKVIGVISIQSLEQERAFDQADLGLLEAVANQAAVAIENARLYYDLRRYIDQLKEAEEKARAFERLSLMSQVGADFVHKMNNLAGTIPVRIASLQAKLKESGLTDPVAYKTLDGISDDAVGLLEAARAIRQATRPEAPVEVDVNELIKTALERVRKTRPAIATVSVQEQLPPDLPKLVVPRNRLMDTLENLITNSVEAMKGKGTLTLRAFVGARDAQKCLGIAIADTGCGIPKANLTKIFDLFFSTKPGGLGFGLWRDKNFVKELGGDIEVESEEGKGSTFTLLIPCAAA